MGLAPPALSRYHPSAMIADGDSVARNAFRVALRDTPLPVPTRDDGQRAPGVTQELDPGDILEVQDMAEAIARAEQPLREARAMRPMRPSNSTDLFETLGQRATDDIAGPSTPAPSGIRSASSFLPPQMPAPVPRYVVVPTVPPPSPDDDAYFHPLGRIRTLADATLDGYRPEPTLLVRARGRRKRLSWVLVAVLVPLAVLAGFALFEHADAASPPSAPSSAAGVTTSTNRVPTTATPPSAPAATVATSTGTAAAPLAAKAAPKPASQPSDGVPVFDVNNLPPAAGGRAKPRTR